MASYEKGARIDSASTTIALIIEGRSSPLYRGDKLLTRKWLMQQTLHDLIYWTAMGELSTAVPVEEEE